ncbi:hypothetical protein C0992_011412, partial [Termitomyces sp. T32_za158]
AHPNYIKWRTTPFPLYDEMANLVDGSVATGDTVFCPGRARNATPPTNSDLYDPSPESDGIQALDNSQDFYMDIIDPTLDEDIHCSDEPGKKIEEMTSAPVTPATLKRTASASLSSTRSAKSRKVSSGEALATVAGSIEHLADSFTADAANTSPQRKRAAIKILEQDAMLSPHSLLRAFKLIRCDTGFADMITSINDKESHTSYINLELEDA